MDGTSEREYRDGLNKINEKLSKREDVRKAFAGIAKMTVEALKKSEEVRRPVEHHLDKIQIDVTKSKDFGARIQEATPIRGYRSKKGNQTRIYRAKNAYR